MQATLLTGGTLVHLDPPRIEAADLALTGSVIGTTDALPTTATIDCSHCLILPGLVVGHTHLYSGLAAGMPVAGPAPTGFLEILERVWWRLDRALDEETLRASALVAAAAALKSGTTCLIDHHESPGFIDGALDVIEEALREVGIRAVLTYGATDRHGPDGAKAGLAESERFVKKNGRDATVRGAIGLHAPFTTSDETLAAAADAARRHQAWLHFHAAEGPDDQKAARERWGTRLFHHLDALGLLGGRTLVAHAVDLDPAEGQCLADREVWVAHQARSNMNNGVGYAGRLRTLDRVALGTDGIDDDLLAELKAAFFRGRESTGPAVWPDPVRMLRRSQELAAALFEATLGHLTPGAPADVVVLAYDPHTPLTPESLGAHLLFGLSSRHVRDVFVAGRPVVRNRRLVGLDEGALAARGRAAAEALFAKMASL